MAGKINSTKSINEVPETTEAELKKQVDVALKVFEGEKLVEASIPKNFAKYIGPTHFIGINGVQIVLPVDGTKHQIPQSFKEHLDAFLENLTM